MRLLKKLRKVPREDWDLWVDDFPEDECVFPEYSEPFLEEPWEMTERLSASLYFLRDGRHDTIFFYGMR